MESHRMIDDASLCDGSAAAPGSGPAGPTQECLDEALIACISAPAPHYATYPAAQWFRPEVGGVDYAAAVARRRQSEDWQAPLALQIHIPRQTTMRIEAAHSLGSTPLLGKELMYLSCLEREIALHGQLFEGMSQVKQLQFRGVSPDLLDDHLLDTLLHCVRTHFSLAPDAVGDYMVDIDHAPIAPPRMHRLRHLGFNHFRLGVQDLDPLLQRSELSMQPERATLAIIAAARAAGFRTISIDLMLGLPHQNLTTLGASLELIIAADPDRVMLHDYVDVAPIGNHQDLIADGDMPACALKGAMLALAASSLAQAGYVHVGMDQFAKAADALAVAHNNGSLRRNLLGYTSDSPPDLVAFGVAAISVIGSAYFQNKQTLDGYLALLDEDRLQIARGMVLSHDDLLRRDLIERLMCNFALSIRAFEHSWSIVFAHYFAAEIEQLQALQARGLVQLSIDRIAVTGPGRLVVNHVCMVFDRYLAAGPGMRCGPAES